jgi:thiazole synthase ThiGH ThiG subunit
VAVAVMVVAAVRVCQELTWLLLVQVQGLPSMVAAAVQQQQQRVAMAAAVTMAGPVTRTAAVAAAGAGRQYAQAGVAAAEAQRIADTPPSTEG